MNIAIIDLGTNSVRYAIYRLPVRGKVKQIYRSKDPLLLGRSVFTSRVISQELEQKTAASLARFRKACRIHHVSEVISVATSAFREAKNSKQVIRRIEKATGFQLHVISGQEEAFFTLLGVMQERHSAHGTTAFIDIGGGSVEVGIIADGEVLKLWSLPLGASRLRERAAGKKQKSEQVAAMRSHIQRVLHEHVGSLRVRVQTVFGTSGTAKAVWRMTRGRTKGREVPLIKLRKLNKVLPKKTIAELRALPGITPARAQTIVPGAIVLEEIISYLGAGGYVCSKHALRDGLFVYYVEKPRRSPLDRKQIIYPFEI